MKTNKRYNTTKTLNLQKLDRNALLTIVGGAFEDSKEYYYMTEKERAVYAHSQGNDKVVY